MYLFRGMRDCHGRLVAAAEALRGELDGDDVSPKLLRLRLEMAAAAHDNLATTQRLWSRVEREIPDIGQRVPDYDRLKTAERDLHVRYASHIAAWPVAAITANFKEFADAKRRFLDDLCRHNRKLNVDLFEPACQMLENAAFPSAQVA